MLTWPRGYMVGQREGAGHPPTWPGNGADGGWVTSTYLVKGQAESPTWLGGRPGVGWVTSTNLDGARSRVGHLPTWPERGEGNIRSHLPTWGRGVGWVTYQLGWRWCKGRSPGQGVSAPSFLWTNTCENITFLRITHVVGELCCH